MKRMKTVPDAFITRSARAVIAAEAAALKLAARGIGPGFVKAIRLFLSTRGKIVVMGVGKSGIIARKIASTLSSTGTPSVYVHPVESLHGDMGLIATPSDDLELSIMNHVRKRLSPLAMPQEIAFVDKVPKTRSGKILRRVLKAKELGLPIGDVSTMDDE